MKGHVYLAIGPRDPLCENLAVLNPVLNVARELTGLPKQIGISKQDVFNTLESALSAASKIVEAPGFHHLPDDYAFCILTSGEGNTQAVKRLLEKIVPKTLVSLITVGPNGGRNALWLSTLRNNRVGLMVASLGDEPSRLAQSQLIGGNN